MAKGIIFQPQPGNPLGSSTRGLWVNSSNDLVYNNSSSSSNITQTLDSLVSGLGTDYLSKLYLNNTGLSIPAFTPVYSPSAGLIALASGNDATSARPIGITVAAIPQGSTGPVAYAGMVPGITGFVHGEYVYLDIIPGQLTETQPSQPAYPSGFTVYIFGVMEGTNLFIQKNLVGTL